MASLKDLRLRIRSVKSTQKFTAAMKGTYIVNLHVNGSPTPSASENILVDVAASLA